MIISFSVHGAPGLELKKCWQGDGNIHPIQYREGVLQIIVTLYLSLITCFSLELQVSLFKFHRQCKAAEVINLTMPGLQRLQNICWLARTIN